MVPRALEIIQQPFPDGEAIFFYRGLHKFILNYDDVPLNLYDVNIVMSGTKACETYTGHSLVTEAILFSG